MPNSPTALQRLQANRLFKVAQLAFSPPDLYRSAVAIAANGNSGRVIPAIFQASETLNNDGDNTLFAYVTYNSAHI